MKKLSVVKIGWLAVNFGLLALPVFLPSSSDVTNLINVCLVLMVLQSFPLNIPASWLFFTVGWFNGSLGTLYLMLILYCAIAYLQWFVVVPRFAQFVRYFFGGSDVQIKISANLASAAQLPPPKNEFSPNDWNKKWYDEEKRTPVERVFDREDD